MLCNILKKRNLIEDSNTKQYDISQGNEAYRVQNDSFAYNSRSELVAGTLGGNAFNFAFDEIGNQTQFACNATNETTIEGDFVPAYDADGNATLVKTTTGTWSVSYNGENRPVRFENAGTQTVVEMNYDYLGRRFEKKITIAGTTTSHHRYVYRGFLQIACLDLTRAGTQEPALKCVIYWDPTEETATRPLAISIVGDNVYFPTVDLTKNVCELVDFYGNVAATYDYAPFGNVSAGTPSGSAVPANPLQWSSEICDSELDLVYYNYRHYSPSLGRFLSRDPIEEQGGLNLYAFVGNAIQETDALGLMIAPGSEIWDPLRPRQKTVSKDDPVISCYKAVKELWKAYEDMRAENTIGADKYFHCIGMCKATRKSDRALVVFLAKLREVSDLLRKGVENGFKVPLKNAEDSLKDMEANMKGIDCPSDKTCEECCCEYKVKGL